MRIQRSQITELACTLYVFEYVRPHLYSLVFAGLNSYE